MKKILLLICLLPTLLFSQQYSLDTKASEIKFVINNFGLATNGKFQGLSGTINWNEKNLNGSSFIVSVDAATIDTDIKSRDNHLKKESYFDVNKFPKITIQSSKISNNNGSYQLEASLTIKGITKKINFPFTATHQNKGVLFKGNFEINRKDFGVGGSSISLSNTVKVQLIVAAQEK